MTIVLNLQNLTQIFWTIIIALNLYVLLLLYRMSRLYRAERKIKLLVTSNLKENIEFMRSRTDKTIVTSVTPSTDLTTRSHFFQQFLNSEPPQLRSCLRVRPNFRSHSSTTAVDEDPQPDQTKQQQNDRTTLRQIHVRLTHSQGHKQSRQQCQQPQRQQQQQQQLLYQPHQQVREQQPKRPQQQEQRQERHYGRIMRSSSMSRATELTSSDENRYTPLPDDEHTLYISDSLGRVVHEIPFRERDYMDALYSVIGDRCWNIKKTWSGSDRPEELQKRKATLKPKQVSQQVQR